MPIVGVKFTIAVHVKFTLCCFGLHKTLDRSRSVCENLRQSFYFAVPLLLASQIHRSGAFTHTPLAVFIKFKNLREKLVPNLY